MLIAAFYKLFLVLVEIFLRYTSYNKIKNHKYSNLIKKLTNHQLLDF